MSEMTDDPKPTSDIRALFNDMAQKLGGMRVYDPVIEITQFFGNCPVQAEGFIGGKPFYFRARGESWSLSIGDDPVGKPDWMMMRKYKSGQQFLAGWMTQAEALGFMSEGFKKYTKYLERLDKLSQKEDGDD